MRLFSALFSLRHVACAGRRRRQVLGGLALVATVTIAFLTALVLNPFGSHAQNANVTISFDMVPAGNDYCGGDSFRSDGVTPCSPANSMTVGSVEFCSSSLLANPNTHTHAAQLIIRNVEDLVGWQARLNYDGGGMRPNTVNFLPFTDNNTAQNVSFNNLPLDGGVHRDLVTASSIPPQAAGPQTAAFGGSYIRAQTFPVSPDTPAKSTPDDTSYSAPSGGILATVILQVVGDHTGQQLFVDMDDAIPNAPGSGISFFNGTGSQDLLLPDNNLGDGYHAEGAACGPATPPPPTPTPTITVPSTPSATPTPTGGGGPAACKCFNPVNTATYCQQGTGAIDKQQLTVSCTPGISPGSHPDIVGSFDLGLGPDGSAGTADDTNDYNFAGLVNFSPTVPDDTAIPVGAILGELGSQPTLGLVNNSCNNSQLRVPFTFVKGTTDINNTVEPLPYGSNNDLAIMAGDTPPFNGVQDIKPAPAVTLYPSFLNAIFDPNWVDFGPDKIAGNVDDTYSGPKSPIKPVFRAVAATPIPAAANLWVILQLVVFDKGTKLPNLPALDPAFGYPSVVVLQQSSATPPGASAITDFCTPLKTVSVSFGVTHDNPDTPANEGGIPIRTLPANGTAVTSIGYYTSQRDADGDGYENSLDTCPFHADTVWNPRGPFDVGDGIVFPPDDLIFPITQDGIPDTCDPTPNEATGGPPTNQPTDHDGDGFINRADNCPLVYNPDQRDTDRDGIGDACDTPGLDAGTDCVGPTCVPGAGRPIPPRTVAGNGPDVPDGPEIVCIKVGSITVGGDPNVAFSSCLTTLPSLDDDGDGVLNPSDLCPGTPSNERPVDANGCSQHQVDADLDGVCDPGKTSTLCSGSDNCPAKPNPSQTDSDGDGVGDACDTTGHGTIPANAATVTIQFPGINPASSVVLITPLGDPGANLLWVSLGTDSFTVHVRPLQGQSQNQKHPPIQFMYQVAP